VNFESPSALSCLGDSAFVDSVLAICIPRRVKKLQSLCFCHCESSVARILSPSGPKVNAGVER
jgi:hypothetical protein